MGVFGNEMSFFFTELEEVYGPDEVSSETNRRWHKVGQRFIKIS